MAIGNTLTTGPDAQTILSLAWAETAGTWGKAGGVASCSALSGGIGFATITSTVSDVLVDIIFPTYTAGSVGIVARYQDSSNYLIAYYNGTNARLDKVVAGVTTNLISGAVTYGATKVLRLILDGTAARLYYGNALVGTGTVPSSTYKLHGLYTTNTGNTFDDFIVFPRSGFTDAPFEELTPTRDTTIKYAGTASAKLVAGGTDANYLQSVTLPDTATYTLIAYAYTTGAAVTTTDLDLWYDGAELTTTFTSMGGGWYKLTGTLTGVASAKTYGVRVHGGKTVYVDTVSLQAGAGATIEVTFENSSSGVANATFENNVTATEFKGKIDGNS